MPRLIKKALMNPLINHNKPAIEQVYFEEPPHIKTDLEDVTEDVPDAAVLMTSRQSKGELVIEKSLKLQEKLKERTKKKGVANPEPGPSVDKAPAAEDNINIDPNSADTDSSEQTSDKEVNLITFEEVEEELVDPNKANMDKTEFNTRFRKIKATELAVKQSLIRLNSGTVSDAVLDSYKSSLQNIKKS